jgi:hypothetical protein
MRNVFLVVFVLMISNPSPVSAQTPDQELERTILHLDSLFWNTYNSCDDARFRDFFSDDVEFYHDKGGVTNGLETLARGFKNNLCGGEVRLRRAVVPGSLQVFPMHNRDTIYGAILSGEHVFYVTEKGKAERLDGRAKFTHLWRLDNGRWKMVRILSFDHGPAAYHITRKEIVMTSKELSQYTGVFHGKETKDLKIILSNGQLNFTNNGVVTSIYPEQVNRFFMKERDISFEFVRGKSQRVESLVVRENGQIVETLHKNQ